MSHNDARLDNLTHDHDEILAWGHDICGLIGEGRIVAARAKFQPYALTLLAHMLTEEQTVFAGLDSEPEFGPSLRRLRSEHHRFREAIAKADLLQDPEWSDVVLTLLHDFALHETEEEEDLFPAAEVALPYPTARRRRQRRAQHPG
jgi:hypothetical protein